MNRFDVSSILLAVVASAFAADITAQEAPVPEVSTPDSTLIETAEGPSPRGAFLRSVAIPGWGQAWVGAPIRGGVYFALETGALWMVMKSRQKLGEARAEESWLRDTGQIPFGQRSEMVTARRAQVEDWTTLAIFFLFFAGADAFVAAHLADFGEHVGVAPQAGGEFRVQARVPVGGRP